MNSMRQVVPADHAKTFTSQLTRWTLGLAFAVFLMPLAGVTWAQTTAPGAGAQAKAVNVMTPVASKAVKVRESVAVRDLPAARTKNIIEKPGADKEIREINPIRNELTRTVDPAAPRTPDEVLWHESAAARGPVRNAPNPASLQFEGISIADTIAVGQGFLPPDTNGQVGPNHYVQAVNTSFRVWDKAGNPLTPTTPLSTLFAPLGPPCGSSDDGDPIVMYDQLADRWFITQFCVTPVPNHQLIAISKTGDPTGAYYLYDFVMPNLKFNDYGKFGVWPDAYYMTDNQFDQAGTAFQGAGTFAFDRAKMLVGDPTAGFIYFDTCPTNVACAIGGMLPSALDGLTPPPAGAPNVFAYFTAGEFGDPADGLRLFNFHADFTTPANSTFTERTGSPLAVAAFDPVPIPNTRKVIPQPAPAVAGSYLDMISDRLMFRLAYRNLGTSESLILNHSVNAAVAPAFRSGVRFYQLSRATPAAAFTVAEQQTFAGPGGDTSHRWMGSGAMNWLGDIAVGYSVSSTSVFPSIRYAAKLHTDPAGGGLAQGEVSIIAGAGSQTSTSNRWGDYSSMTVDPTDDCTFWYTTEYYPVSSEPGNATAPWHTRIAKMSPGVCSTSPRGSINGTITNCTSGLPIANAIVQITGGYSRATIANGTYSATVPPSTYNATATGTGYDSVAVNGLVVSNGGTATFNACLTGNLKQPVADTAAIVSAGPNGVIDPNEVVTVSFGIKNTGTLNTASLVATLQPTGGVTSPGAPQNYGAVLAGGSTVFRSFTFTSANLTCGTTLVATLALQDGATNLGTIAYNLQTGVLTSSLYSTGNIAVPIPDANATGVDIPLNVPDTVTLADVNASFRINHTWDSDVSASLVHPDGTIVALVTRRGTDGDNFGTGANSCAGTPTVLDDQAATAISAGAAPFAGSYRPEAPLSALNGKASNGGWKLRVSDSAAGDTGTVGCFNLQVKRFVCAGAQINATTPVTISAENALPPNNAPDPNERLTETLPLLNAGADNTTSLVATLQATGGVTNPSGPQNFGVVVGGGAAVARPFTFTATGSCGANITLTLALQDGAASLGTINYTQQLGITVVGAPQTFSNAGAILVPAGQPATTIGVSAPYPSNITVSGVVGTVSKVTVGLKLFNHTYPTDVDLLLVSPTGQKMIIMSDVGSGNDAVNANLVLDDAAATLLPNGTGSTIVSGTFRPTNVTAGDTFAAPAPAGPYLSAAPAGTDTLNSAFAGQDPNGTWSLYVVDDSSFDIGNFNGGWELTFTTSTNVCSVPPAVPPAFVSAQSRRVHGAAGPFNLPLSLVSTNPTTEPRQGPVQTVVFTFDKPIIGATAAITEGAATAGVPTFSGNDVIVGLTGVTDRQYVTISLTNVADSTGGTGGNASVRVGFLIGDVNQSRAVSIADLGLVNAQLSQPVAAANYLRDVNVSGTLTLADKGLTNANLSQALPPP